jgi:Chaperone of endosialidase
MRKPSPAMIVALFAICCATLFLTAASASAAGQGDPFLLGQDNTIDLTTSLSGNSAGGPQLLVTNANGDRAGIKAESAGGGAGAVYGLHSSAEGAGAAVQGISLSTAPSAFALYGLLESTSSGAGSAALRAQNKGTNAGGYGVWASHAGSGDGVYGTSVNGRGVWGQHSGNSGSSPGVFGQTSSPTGAGVLGVNFAGGPGLAATVNLGVPPLKVNSSVLVTNLNADRLDGYHASAFWKLGGNAGTDPGTHFLGTTDEKPLVLKVNGLPALRLEPVGITSPNLIGGFTQNDVGNVTGATIAGGGYVLDENYVSGSFGSVGGGVGNRAGNAATVAGGFHNIASGPNSAVAGGGTDVCFFCDVTGNTASGGFSAVAGGKQNTASGYGSTVAGGRDNIASGDYSFAVGYKAVADDTRSFVWSDGSWIGGNVYSPAAHSFSAHAAGGFNLWTNTSGPTTGCWIVAGGGSINCSSSRRVKKDFARVDGAQLLGRLARIPVSTWSYKNEKAGVRHIGPMAQDFARAFRVGEDDTSIAMVDADGVALAAIQGLYRQNQALNGKVAGLQRQNRALSARLARLERAVAKRTR